MDKYKDWIINWFVNECSVNEQDVLDNLDANYFQSGWIDSMKFMSFIMDMEDTFDIEFSNDEFQNREFSTVLGLAAIIESKSQ